MRKSALILLETLCFCGFTISISLDTVYEWRHVEYEYPNEKERQKDLDSGNFIISNAGIIDVDVYRSQDNPKEKTYFVTIPRFEKGIPCSLGTVLNETYKGNPLIRAYPSWDWHKNIEQCKNERIVSVFRVYIDKCGRLWILDNGRNATGIVCPPQILAFNLKTNKLIYKYEIPKDQYEPRSTFVTPIADIRGSCEEVFIYAADCQAFSLVVYDVQKNVSWNIVDKTFYPYPDYGTYKILGDQFDIMDGILGLSLSPYKPNKDRRLFYQAMSSNTQNYVQTSLIRDRNKFKEDPMSSPQIFHTYPKRRNTQSAAEAIDKNGVMYFGLMNEITLDCWDTSTDYNMYNFGVISNNVTSLQFISGAKVIDCPNNKNQELYIVSNRFQKLGAGTLNPNEVNFRILTTKIDKKLTKLCKARGD